MRIPWSYLFMGLTAVGILLFFVLGGPQALRVGLLNKETIVVPPDPGNPSAQGRTLELVTLLPPDGIQAILNPQFISPAEATRYVADEPVLGVTINGDSRAYSIPFLSGREVVNDTVGGIPIAVTW
ncbi:MAG: DUF3179 domain-containing protein [Chloroflexi bacterium]|nr:DUF3179 domain-containing protein [Chloroflexota bacterium]MBT4074498.1 DUF3179 domain-containing protein [Chloroflexota bacterium]MBT4514604.1 DUF3179 domain-containing protein [Chloroflexota bacterium]MBT6682136.1 DUF3179 domain-containing protein [Chloroflexota bacterium]